MTLREYVEVAIKEKTAIGHFNACTIDGIWAVADAAREMNLPVIIGASEGERDYIGLRQLVAIVKSIREERDQPIFLNADHSYSFNRVKEAIDVGFDSAIFDGAQLPIDENIAITRKCVDYAKSYNQAAKKDILIEGELGFIGSSSKVLDEVPAGAITKEGQMTTSEEAVKFIHSTGIDLLAPAVGNIHGMIKGGDPALNVGRVSEISQATQIPLVLHGASGNSAEDISNAIKAGVAIVHVNTELRIAYRAGLMKSLSEDPEEVSPYKYLKPAKLAMQKVVLEKLKIISLL
jgi:fructose-bisphosphate aldolase, class II